MSLKKRIILAIVILIPVSVFPWINYFDLRFEEPRRGIVALEMYLSGDYIVPRIHGSDYYNKPPFFNWMILGLFKLFNRFDEWMVRLPSLLGWLAMGVLNFFLVRKYINKETAWLASLFFLTAGDVYFYESMESGEIDLFYSFLVYSQVISIFYFREQKKWLPLFLLSYLFMALGLLTKGMPSLVFQGLTLLGIAIWYRQWKWLFSWQHVAGVALSALLVGSYLSAYAQRANLHNFLLKLFNEASEKSGLESRWTDVLLSPVNYPIELIKWLLPWSMLSVFIFARNFKVKVRNNPFLVFIIIFILFNLPLYFFTGYPKSRYVFMFFPFFTTLIAYFTIENAESFPRVKKFIEWFWWGAMILISLVILVAPFLNISKGISLAGLKGWGFGIPLVFILLVYYKHPSLRIYLFLLFIVLGKTAFNNFYFPIFKSKADSMNFKTNMEKIVEITGKDPVYYYDNPDTMVAKMALGPLKLDSAILSVPPFVSYELPFYYSQFTKNILRFSPKLEPGNYYITFSDVPITQPFTLLYHFPDVDEKKEVLLIQTGRPE